MSSDSMAVVAAAAGSGGGDGGAAAGGGERKPVLSVAMAQVASVRNDPEANLAEIDATLARYAADVDLVLFPELFLTGYDLTHDEFTAGALSLGDLATGAGRHPTLDKAFSLAKKHNVAYLLSFPERIEESVFICAAIIDADGTLAHKYHKTHLWSDYEKAVFTPNQDPGCPKVFTLKKFPHIPIGIIICFDLEFPEPSRLLSLAGAKVAIVPVAIACDDMDTIVTFVRARAMENNMTVLLTNHSRTAPESNNGARKLKFGGTTTAGFPDGSTQALPSGSLYDKQVMLVEVDPWKPSFEAYAKRNPYLADRRPLFYFPIVAPLP